MLGYHCSLCIPGQHNLNNRLVINMQSGYNQGLTRVGEIYMDEQGPETE